MNIDYYKNVKKKAFRTKIYLKGIPSFTKEKIKNTNEIVLKEEKEGFLNWIKIV